MAVIGASDVDSKAISAREIRERILVEMAAVRAMDRVELEKEVEAAGGDEKAEVDSPQAEVILARLETHFGRKLPGPADLDPEQFTSISALISLVERRLADNESTTVGNLSDRRDGRRPAA